MPSTNFQGQVTQAINTVGLLAGLTGAPQERKEQQALEGTLKAAGEMKNQITQQLEDKTLPDTERAALERTIEHINDQVERHSERLTELRPSAKNIQNLMDAYTATGRNRARVQETGAARAEYQEGMEAEAARREEEALAEGAFGTPPEGMVPTAPRYDETRAQKAMERSQKQQAARQKRRSFVRDYLPNIETNLGGKVGDFPKDVQRELGKNYSPKERKEIMDRMDKENKDKGGKQ